MSSYSRNHKEYYWNNRERILEKRKESYNRNKEKVLIKNGLFWIKYYKNLKEKVLSHYSKGNPKCNFCGYTDIRALQIDHIEEDGAEHKREVGGSGVLRDIVKNNYPEKFQVLCANCNIIKEFQRKIKNSKYHQLAKSI